MKNISNTSKAVGGILGGGALATGIAVSLSASSLGSKEPKTIREKLRNEGFKPFTLSTSKETAGYSLGQEIIFPQSAFEIKEGAFFDKSPAILVSLDSSKNLDLKGKSAEELRKICLQALDKDLNVEGIEDYIEASKKWCVELTVKEVLERNKFVPITNETPRNVFEEILAGGWFVGNTFEDQKFFSNKTLFGIDGGDSSNGITNTSKIKEEHIQEVKRVCSEELKKPFKRVKFPLGSNILAGNSTQDYADKFQEAVFFCVEPKTAQEFIRENLNFELVEVSSAGKTGCVESDYSWKTFNAFYNSETVYFWNKITALVDNKKCLKS